MEAILFSKNAGWFENQGFYRFSKPVKIIKYINNRLLINNKIITTEKPLLFLEKLIRSNGFFAIGFISYTYTKRIVNNIYKYDDIRLPDMYFALFKNFEKIPMLDSYNYSIIKKIKIPDKKSFIYKVIKAKEYIEKGDIYQVNLTHRIELDGFFYPVSVFFSLAEEQPAPYLMLLKEKDFSIISGSMELFLEKTGNEIKTKPIKGTRRRGLSEEEDRLMYEELKSSKKERAENLMITDLMRNDLNRISENVFVESLFDIEKYSSLYQMVSTVKGYLKEDLSLQDIIDRTFPPGSVTGAPKKRAIEIINELEDYTRSVYCGATVLIKPDMNFVMSVAIRQSIFKNHRCYIYVGSGIVSDSDPEKEYEETLLKAKANLKAMGIYI